MSHDDTQKNETYIELLKAARSTEEVLDLVQIENPKAGAEKPRFQVLWEKVALYAGSLDADLIEDLRWKNPEALSLLLQNPAATEENHREAVHKMLDMIRRRTIPSGYPVGSFLKGLTGYAEAGYVKPGMPGYEAVTMVAKGKNPENWVALRILLAAADPDTDWMSKVVEQGSSYDLRVRELARSPNTPLSALQSIATQVFSPEILEALASNPVARKDPTCVSLMRKAGRGGWINLLEALAKEADAAELPHLLSDARFAARHTPTSSGALARVLNSAPESSLAELSKEDFASILVSDDQEARLTAIRIMAHLHKENREAEAIAPSSPAPIRRPE